MQTIQILLIPATVFGSVLLVCSCLFFKRFRRNERNASGSVPNKNKSEKTKGDKTSKIHGIANTAFTVENEDGDLHKNDANVYDYATNEHIKKKKYGRWSKSKASGKDRTPDVSPVYDDVDGSSTTFYYTLERHPAQPTGDREGYAGTPGNQEIDEGSYVIAIPENIYDKPEGGMTEEITAEGKSAEEDSSVPQLYYTLEECTDENENSQQLSCPNMAAGGSLPKEVSIEVEAYDQMHINDEETYVINIPNEVHEMTDNLPMNVPEHENERDNVHMETQEQFSEEMYVVDVPNDINDSNKLSEIKGDRYLRNTGTQRDNDEEYSEDMGIEVDKDDQYSGQFEIEEDGEGYSQNMSAEEGKIIGTGEDIYDPDNIYENVNAHLYSKNKLHHGISASKSSNQVKKEKHFEENVAAVSRKENMGYVDDEMLKPPKLKVTKPKVEKKPKENVPQSKSDEENTYVIPADVFANNSANENNSSDDNKRYFDDDIYEDWEDNIIGRGKRDSGELCDDMNASGESCDDMNESGDEVYLNENFDSKEQDQDSGRGSFYENLTDFRNSLVIEVAR